MDKQPVLLNHAMSGVRFGYLMSTYEKEGRTLYVLDMGKFEVNFGTRSGFRILTADEAEALESTWKTTKKPSKSVSSSKKRKAQGIPSVGRRKCACGMCEELTGGSFAPGHDMKAKAMLNGMLQGKEGIILEDLASYIRKKSQWKDKYGSLI